MARALVLPTPIGLALWLAACQPAPSETVTPTVVAELSPSALPEDPEPPAPAAVQDDRFVVTLSSRCADTWKAALVREDEADPPQNAHYEVQPQSSQELRLRPGDAIVFTTPHGGILAMRFDDVAAGDGARVEVTPECTGVQKTAVRAGSTSAAI